MTQPIPQLLLSLCARGEPPSAVRVLGDEPERRHFVEMAKAHGVVGAALSSLERSAGWQGLPDPVRAELSAELQRMRMRTGLWIAERERVLGALRDEGLDPVVLKGAALCSTIYDDPVERQFGDLDLLVEKDGVAGARQRLVGLGYRAEGGSEGVEGYAEHHFHLRMVHPVGFITEIHWGLTRPDEPFHLDPGGFLDRSVRLASGGRELRVPSAEDHLMHAVSQNVQDGFVRLNRTLDIDRLVGGSRSLDWELVARTARAGALGPATALSLDLAARLLGTSVDPEVRAVFAPPAPTRVHLALLRPHQALLRPTPGRPESEFHLLNLWLRAETGVRGRYLAGIAAGKMDPLTWLWRHESPEDQPPPSRLHGMVALVRLVGRQIGLYLRGLVSALTPGGRDELRAGSGGEGRAKGDLAETLHLA